jgi:PAS domain S-box-containing protein
MGLAFVALYVGLHHLIFFARARNRLELVAFALMCFVIAAYDVASAGLYSSLSAAESVLWLQWKFRATVLFGIFFLRFVLDVTGKRAGRLDYGLWACWIALLAAQLLPFTNEWPGKASSPTVLTLLGSQVTFYESESGLLTNLRDALGLISVAYVLVSLVKCVRPGKCRKALSILIGVVCLSAAVANDVLVDYGVLHSIYLMEWGFMALLFGVVYSVGLPHDQILTGLSRAEAQSLRLAGAVKSTGESVVITDAAGVIQYVNPAFERMTGYSSAECIGRPASMLKSGKHAAAFYSDMWSQVRAGKTWHGIFIDRKKDGSLFEEDSTVSPIRDQDGTIVSFVAIKRDVTHERFMEKQVLRSLSMSAIGQFAHRVAHDFNNALTSIIGYSELIQLDAGARGLAEIEANAGQIKSSGMEIAKLNADLMAFAHPGKLQIRKVRADRLLKGSEHLIRSSVGSKVAVSIEAEDLAGTVMADQDRIEKAVMELVLNACEAMKAEGALSIVVRAIAASELPVASRWLGKPEDDPAVSQFVVVAVSDSGPGIPEQDKLRLFDPFFTTRDKGRHAGLGLAHVWKIVNEHDGFVHIESHQGQGTAVKLFFPLVRTSASMPQC